LISLVMLGWINRLGGAALGVFLGALFVAAILAIWVKFASPGEIIYNSKIAPVLLNKLPFVLGLLPSDFKSVRDFFK
jgi:membrane protein required for colicin V production